LKKLESCEWEREEKQVENHDNATKTKGFLKQVRLATTNSGVQKRQAVQDDLSHTKELNVSDQRTNYPP